MQTSHSSLNLSAWKETKKAVPVQRTWRLEDNEDVEQNCEVDVLENANDGSEEHNKSELDDDGDADD